jgi:NDP-4-keto-2,6-dideoxyhexose 3-C-methyltransferase
MYKAIEKCRLCGNQELVQVLDLGMQYLTGTFPRQPNGAGVTRGPLSLVKCLGNEDTCGLLQLGHNYEPSELYGLNYGYRSGLNEKMVRHLESKVNAISDLIDLEPEDLVIDIGSNDGTTLGFFAEHLMRLGIDPTADKFRDLYKPGIEVIADFFSDELINKRTSGKKAKVITSFSMLYDLENPIDFATQIKNILAEDGVWVFEQSYAHSMIEELAYDTVCHEHLEYYELFQIEWMLEKVGLRVIDVEINDVNGGSFSVVAAHSSSGYIANNARLEDVRSKELRKKARGMSLFLDFRNNVESHRDQLTELMRKYNDANMRVFGIGASTKGNVLLQYCGFGPENIIAIGEINLDKSGAYTPGSWIPIVSESEVLRQKPDVLLVLPWHFREFFEQSKKFQGSNLLFPLPKISLISR